MGSSESAVNAWVPIIVAAITIVPATIAAINSSRAHKGHGDTIDQIAGLREENAADHARVRGELQAVRRDVDTVLTLLQEHVGDRNAHGTNQRLGV